MLYPPSWTGSGEFSHGISHLLTCTRANTACKVAAFGAPRWAFSETFWLGDMALSEMEVKLCEAYERRGRPDLAHCVRNARAHQLLDAFFGTDLYTPAEWLKDFLSHFYAMKLILDPGSRFERMTSIRQWDIETEKKYKGDEGLALVKQLDQERFKTRVPSRIVYPTQRMIGRMWRGCRRIIGRKADP